MLGRKRKEYSTIREKENERKFPAGEFTCFLCTQPMTVIMTDPRTGVYGGWCGDCQVTEEREPYMPRMKAASCVWDGAEIRYIDHGAEHWSSPA